MEIMFLLLSKKISNSSVSVTFLPTDSPDMRRKAVLPAWAIHEDDENPYYADAVEKYLGRPEGPQFNNIKYAEYFQRYNIKKVRARTHPLDKFGNSVLEKTKQTLTRFRYLRIEDGEPFFYQQLLLKRAWRSEEQLRGRYSSYRENFRALYPAAFEQASLNAYSQSRARNLEMIDNFSRLMDNILSSINNCVLNDITAAQLRALQRMPHHVPHDTIMALPPDQYHVLSIIRNHFGPESADKHPYFFITGSAGTGKTFMINTIVETLQARHEPYLLMAPTGVAAQNIGGRTIHSCLRIRSTDSGYITLLFHNPQFLDEIRRITTILIDEVSMVSASLLDFISETFARLHGNAVPFGGIRVIVVGDLAQLPPVIGLPVYRAGVWRVFYPLFLTHSHRQARDPAFYQLLQRIRLGDLAEDVWNILLAKESETASRHNHHTLDILETTHILGYRENAARLNRMICNTLPLSNTLKGSNEQPAIIFSEAVDFLDNRRCDLHETEHIFRSRTNLPEHLQLQIGARIMWLDNTLFENGICNGSVGVITGIEDYDAGIKAIFPVSAGIVEIIVRKVTKHFYVNGFQGSRTQYPIQNAFALTVHKTQGLTLSRISVSLDEQMFARGQAYVALSRACSLDSLDITSLTREAFLVDEGMLQEYQRLNAIAAQTLTN